MGLIDGHTSVMLRTTWVLALWADGAHTKWFLPKGKHTALV